MSDWHAFVKEEPWANHADSQALVVSVGPGSPLASDAASLFPQFSRLLAAATTTDLLLDGSAFRLFTWENRARTGWLSPAPERPPPVSLFPEHQALLSCFGGVVERFNEPAGTWLLNTNDSLTASQARKDASFVLDASWAFEEAGLAIPINVGDYYPISWEANGNCVLCNRGDGSVLMFAHDHAFDHLTVLDGCPPYTLYRIDGAPDFRSWVETVASQWLRAAA